MNTRNLGDIVQHLGETRRKAVRLPLALTETGWIVAALIAAAVLTLGIALVGG